MASRFEKIDEEYSDELQPKRENENTKNSTKWWKMFKKSGRMKEICKQI